MKAHPKFVALAAIGLLAVSFVPQSVAQEAPGIKNPEVSTPTVLYMHINGFQDFPINTQKPEDKYSESEQLGLATNTVSCFPEGLPVDINEEFHTFYGYSSPSYVEYNFLEGGKPRVHPERGLSFDTRLDTSVPFNLYWYVATQTQLPDSADPTNPNQVPVVVPNMVVRATIRAGDAISVDDKAYNTGEIIAQGQTEPATLAAQATTAPAVYKGQVGPLHVYEFKVTMNVNRDVIPRATGYNLRVDMFIPNPAGCSDPGGAGYFMPNFVRVHTSKDFRPRFELNVLNPIRIEYMHPQFVGDDLVIHTSMNSPWGNYDVDESPGGVEIVVTGPSPSPSLVRAVVTQRYHEHYFHQEAVDMTYVWPYKTDRAADGLYNVALKVWNDQRTAVAEASAQFEVGKGTVFGCGSTEIGQDGVASNADCKQTVQKDGVAPKKDSPAAAMGVLVVVLAAAMIVRRRKA